MARAAVWAAFLRQDPALLAGLPDGLRSRSARLLTDLLAADLNALGETLAYLSARTALTIDYTTAAVAAARALVLDRLTNAPAAPAAPAKPAKKAR
jgi:heme oxygenase